MNKKEFLNTYPKTKKAVEITGYFPTSPMFGLAKGDKEQLDNYFANWVYREAQQKLMEENDISNADIKKIVQKLDMTKITIGTEDEYLAVKAGIEEIVKEREELERKRKHITLTAQFTDKYYELNLSMTGYSDDPNETHYFQTAEELEDWWDINKQYYPHWSYKDVSYVEKTVMAHL